MTSVTRPGLATYYTLIVTETVSLIGSRISGLAVSISVFGHTGHATPLALVAFFYTVPQLLAQGFGGALADRFDRRALMLIANLGFVLCSGLLLISFRSGAFQLWHLYALTFASALFAALDGPAFQASVAMLVPDHHRDRANAIGQLTSPIAGIIAPALAGLLYATMGVTGAITVDLATFGVAILVLLAVRIPMPTLTAEGRVMAADLWRQAFDGFRYLIARPLLFGLTGYVSLVNFLVSGVGVLATPYVLARTHSAASFGLVLTAFNFGALSGAILMAAWGGTRPRIHTIMLGISLGGAFLALTGAAQTTLELGVSFFLFMFCLPFVNASAMSLFQAKIAPDVQGRTFAAMNQLAMILTPAAFLATGPLADRVFEPAVHTLGWRAVAWIVGDRPGAGMGLMLLIAGAATMLLSLAVYALPAIRRIESILPEHTPEIPLQP